MGKNVLKRINIIDFLAVVTAVLFISALVCYNYLPLKTDYEKKILVTVRLSNNINEIYPEAIKKGDIYLNSVNVPVEVTSVAKNTVSGSEKLDITVRGYGTDSSGRYIFNGQRVLIGQKAELHGNFWAQGIISGIENAN